MQINYYDNKRKNLFVMLSALAILIFNVFSSLISVYNTDSRKFMFSQLVEYRFSNINWLLLYFLPHVLLLIYAITIFTNLKVKNWLLSIYFLTFSFYAFILLYNQINSSLEYFESYRISYVLYEILSEISFGALLGISILFMFIGTINNFYLKKFIKIGVIIQGIFSICSVVITIISLISTGKILINRNETLHSILFFYTHNIISLLLLLSYTCFFVSLFFLITRKKEPSIKENTLQE